MIIGEGFQIKGTVVRDNEQYRLTDNRELKNLVVSRTELKARKSTNGHKHDGLEEVYIFTRGNGSMQIDDRLFAVCSGDVVIVPAGAFHKVAASVNGELQFLAIFQAYERPKVDNDPFG